VNKNEYMYAVEGQTLPMNAFITSIVLLLLASDVHSQRTLHIGNIVSPATHIFVFSASSEFLATAESHSDTVLEITSDEIELLLAPSSISPRCSITVAGTEADVAVVISSMLTSIDGKCSASVFFSADGVDQTQIGLSRARVAMTSDVSPFAFYGQTSYHPPLLLPETTVVFSDVTSDTATTAQVS